MSMISHQIDELKGLLKATREYPKHGFNVYGKESAAIIKEAIETISELSEKVHALNMERSMAYYNDGWIPCSERLPEEKTNPITKDGYVYPVTVELLHDRDVKYYTFCNGHWYYGGTIMDSLVIAWMPRPKIYEGGDENE